MEDNASGLGAWLRYLKYWLWDRWHGVSVSAFDERRATQDEAPGLNPGFVRITWAFLVKTLLALLTLVLVASIGLLLAQMDWRAWLPTALIFAAGFVAGFLFKSVIGGKNG
jgi:uncharacterized integral membrane protein